MEIVTLLLPYLSGSFLRFTLFLFQYGLLHSGHWTGGFFFLGAQV